MKTCRGLSPLMQAVFDNDVFRIPSLLKYLGLQSEDYARKSALMLAAIKGHTEMIPHLLREANLISKNGKTALIYALDCKRADCAKILV